MNEILRLDLSDELRKRASEIVNRFNKAYPEAHLELNFSNPFELLIATILAAQCTDAKVNEVTQTLFQKFPNPKAFLEADYEELVQDLTGITFAGSKAKYIKNTCEKIVDEFNGELPRTVEELTKFSGVGRKTANIVLANAMNIPAIGVDTHTIRVPNRLGLVKTQNPDNIEQALYDLLPKEKWRRANIVIQWHGRYTCTAKRPKCGECVVFDLCEWEDKEKFS